MKSETPKVPAKVVIEANSVLKRYGARSLVRIRTLRENDFTRVSLRSRRSGVRIPAGPPNSNLVDTSCIAGAVTKT